MGMLKKDGYYKKQVICPNGMTFVTKCQMPTLGNSSKREPKTMPSSERQERKNLNKAIDNLFYLLLSNFLPGDFNLALTYAEQVDKEQAVRTVQKFLTLYRAYCKSHGYKPDYIYNTEKHGSATWHHHVVLHNHADIPNIEFLWKKAGGGSVQHNPAGYMLWANWDWYGLAKYICGVKKDNKGNEYVLPHEKGERRFKPSHGLKRPKIVYEWIDADRWYKPKAPKGWYIVPDSIRSGADELTGGNFIKYLMKRVD